MISAENITHALQMTLTANVQEAEAMLTEMRQSPSFLEAILHVLTTDSRDVIRQAAATQLHMLLHENEQVYQSITLDLISRIFNSSSPLVQSTLLITIDAILQYFVENAMFEQLIQYSMNAMHAAFYSGFVFLDELTQLGITGHEYYNNLVPALNLAIEFTKTTQFTTHGNFQQIFSCILRAFKNIYLSSSSDAVSDEAVATIFSLSANFLGSEYDITSDLSEAIMGAIYQPIYTQESDFNPQFIQPLIEPLLAILTYRNKSHGTITGALNILELLFEFDSTFAVIEPFLEHIITNIFIPILSPPPNIEEADPLQVLDLIFPAISENITPTSAAASALKAGAPRIARQCLEFLGSFDDPSTIYASLFMLSKLAKSFTEEDSEAIASIMDIALQCLQSDSFIAAIAGCAFFTGFEKIDNGEILQSLFSLMMETENEVMIYMAMCAVGKVLGSFTEAKEAVFDMLGDKATDVITKVFEMNGKYPTQWMADTVVNFTEFFAPQLQDLALEYTGNLIVLLRQYMEEDSSEAHLAVGTVCDAIDQVATSQKANIAIATDIVNFIMQQVNEMLYDGCSNYDEEIITLLCTCINTSPEFTEVLAQIPTMLHHFYDEEDSLIEAIAPAIKVLALKFPQSFEIEDVTRPIYDILTSLLSDEEEFMDNYWESLIQIFQAIFVRCCNSSFAQHILPDIAHTLADWDLSVKDIAASLITCNPRVLIEFPVYYRFWIENSNPAAFLRAAVSVFEHWDQLPQIHGSRNEILELCYRSVGILHGVTAGDEAEEDDSDDNDLGDEDYVLFDVQSLCNHPFFKQ